MKLLTKMITVLVPFVIILPIAIAQTDESQEMSERFEQMDQMMEQMRGSGDPVERREIMRKHMRMMQEQMMSMNCMMGEIQSGACTGSEMGMGMMGDGEDSAMNMPMHDHMQMMHRKMGMMQGMMKQMLNHNRMMMEMNEIGHED
jgi:cell fate (sporulation/competence/biofilm development) regulator YlbF (YheA/YmcA/DUF963 family)